MLSADAPGVAEPFALFPDVGGAEPELEAEFPEPELDESGLEADPLLGAVPPAAPGALGRFPHGEVPGVPPRVVFGFMVEGFVVLPGVGGFVELAPGTVDGVFGVGEGVVGVEELAGGVALAPDGVVVLPGDCWPAVPELPAAGAEPPAGAACAMTQEAQSRITESKKRLFVETTLTENSADNMRTPPAQILVCGLSTSSRTIARSTILVLSFHRV
ncbi:MAG TPA: hypothetical protein VN946_24935 [Terriglobales bacterium]|nr:hypothetical protein [Terriglobales bacterium]